MAVIEPLSRCTSDYLAQFSVCAICITSGAEIVIASPASLGRASAVCAWWTRDRRAALEVVQAIDEACPVSIDQAIAEVGAAADRLGAVLSDHAVVLQRAGAAVRELDLRLEAAQSSGTMAFFNSEFRKRRLSAAKSGVKFIPYWEARRRLRQVLASAAAGRSVSELMQAVFDAQAKL